MTLTLPEEKLEKIKECPLALNHCLSIRALARMISGHTGGGSSITFLQGTADLKNAAFCKTQSHNVVTLNQAARQ